MKSKTKQMVGVGIFTAIVIVLQLLGGGIKVGSLFSITLVLLPIVVGSAVYNWKAGAWLGLTFGVTVLLTGDAAAFMAISVPATIAVVLVKGVLCGFAAGLTYKLLSKVQSTVAVIAAAIVCPIVNTGIFMLGCYLFFLPDISKWAIDAGYADASAYILYGLIGINFLVELGTNIVLSPVIVRLIRIGRK